MKQLNGIFLFGLILLLITACADSGLDKRSLGEGDETDDYSSVGGAAKVSIPDGAFDGDMNITVEEATDAPVGHFGKAFNFKPEDTTFKIPVTISINYDASELAADKEKTLVLGVFQNKVWSVIEGSIVDLENHRVTGETVHFSLYAPIFVNNITGEPDDQCELDAAGNCTNGNNSCDPITDPDCGNPDLCPDGTRPDETGDCNNDPTDPECQMDAAGNCVCGGFAGFACPDNMICVYNDLTCSPETGGADCMGICEYKDCDPLTDPTCGDPDLCPDGTEPDANGDCGDDPTDPDCQMDAAGNCVCGGFAGFACPDNMMCVYNDPACSPENGGADCMGICEYKDCDPLTDPGCGDPDPTDPDCQMDAAGNCVCGGFAGFACPDNMMCVYNDLTCSPENGGADCMGICEDPGTCEDGTYPDENGDCHTDPNSTDCQLDAAGNCLCGGIAGFTCPEGLACYFNDPDCDPATGAADCMGYCM